MSVVGEQLRSARKAQKMSERDVAEITKLRADHVLAIEEGNFEVFPARVYVRGFVRTYAKLLKLDSDKVMSELDKELESSTLHRQAPPLDPGSRSIADSIMFQLSRINWKVMLPVMAILIVALGTLWGIRAWKEAQTRDPLAGLPEAVYQPAKPLPVETLPIPVGTLTNR